MNRTLLSLALSCFVLAACSESFSVGNVDGRVTSVGPVYQDGDDLVIFFTTYDREGDELDVTVEIDRGTGMGREPADGLSALPTDRNAHTTHVVSVPALGAESISVRIYPAGLQDRGILSEGIEVGTLGVNP